MHGLGFYDAPTASIAWRRRRSCSHSAAEAGRDSDRTLSWVPLMRARDVPVTPLRPANCGFGRWLESVLQRALRRASGQAGGDHADRCRRHGAATPGRIRRDRDGDRREPGVRVVVADTRARTGRWRSGGFISISRRGNPLERVVGEVTRPRGSRSMASICKAGSASAASRHRCCASVSRRTRCRSGASRARDQASAIDVGPPASDRRSDQQRRRNCVRRARRKSDD